MTKKRKAAQEEARAHLRKLCSPGTTVHSILRHTSRSGMMRHIDFILLKKDGSTRWLSGWIAQAMDIRQHNGGVLKVSGCGMDMGFHIVNNLSYVLHGFKEDDVATHVARIPKPQRDKLKPDHHRPGYTLDHNWL